MQELETVNKYLGGHRITIKGVKSLLSQSTNFSPGKNQNTQFTICEIGCGGGDNLKAIQRWCSSKQFTPRFIGIDINKECIAYAKENCRALDVQWITSDYRSVSLTHKPDIIFSSLFCHHFTDEELVKQFEWMKENSQLGFFINDLHRHPFAFYSIKWLTNFFSKSYMVKNDAPLSVLRGFQRKELELINKKCATGNIQLSWHWAFRWLLVVKNEK